MKLRLNWSDYGETWTLFDESDKRFASFNRDEYDVATVEEVVRRLCEGLNIDLMRTYDEDEDI